MLTRELQLRKSRPQDPEALTGALVTLAQTLANAPAQVLQQLVQSTLELCHAGSAGISFVEEEDGKKLFRSHAIAGSYAPHLHATAPLDFSPGGMVLDSDAVQLMAHLEGDFPYLAELQPRIIEALIIPFHVRGEAVGTLWALSHAPTRKFDAEDARVITTLSEFAAATYQTLCETQLLKSLVATIREPLLVLDGALRVHRANRSFCQMFELDAGAIQGQGLEQLGRGEWDIPALREGLRDLFASDSPLENFKIKRDAYSTESRPIWVNARKLRREQNETALVLLTIEDAPDLRLQIARSGFQEMAGDRAEDKFPEIVGQSAAMKHLFGEVEVVADTDATVLILGETGTGKELIARALHRIGPRKNRPFVSLNCAAIPTGLLESELFGYEKGAFTGALAQKLGRFELASGGTLFLDEVGDIPLELQPKLLRALQEKSFERLGGTKTNAINVRLVAATNRDLSQMMREKLFRSDLYYRLMVFPIRTPPLREHSEDIPILVRHFVRHYAAKMGRVVDRISARTMTELTNWSWPGNVRELENFIERSVILSPGSELNAPLAELVEHLVEHNLESDNSTLVNMERRHIIQLLRKNSGVVSVTAAQLGVPRTTLSAMLKRLGISRGD